MKQILNLLEHEHFHPSSMRSNRLYSGSHRVTWCLAIGLLLLAMSLGSAWAVQTTTVLPSKGNNGYSVFDWTLGGAAGDTYTTWAGNINSTQVKINGAFNVALGGVDFTASPPFWETQQTWAAFADLKTAPTFTSFAVTNAPGNMASYGSFSYQMTGVSGSGMGMNVIWSPVPEPTSALAGILLAAGLLRRKRW